jgi:hypothetical protein
MTTRTFVSTLGRLALAAVVAAAGAGCGSELLRTGRSPVYLTITQLQAAQGNSPSSFVNNLLSDVERIEDVTVGNTTTQVATYYNDLGRVTFNAAPKDPTLTPTSNSVISMTRYSVQFVRTDGRNTPGVDVPYPFEGGMSGTVIPSAATNLVFDLVRHSAKLEAPLRNLRRGGGQIFIATIAQVTFYGRDQNGNEVVVTGSMDVTFGDFGDS